MSHFSDFDALRQCLSCLPGRDQAAWDAVWQRDRQLTKPPGSLGRLEEIAAWMAAWQGNARPQAETIKVHVYAGNHGIAQHGVSAFPSQVTAQMVDNFHRGGAAINQICRVFSFDLHVEALDLDRPSADFGTEPALSEADCLAAMKTGFAALGDGCDLLCLGEMGIGNTTAASALACAIFSDRQDQDPSRWTGFGTGITPAIKKKKQALIARALRRHGDCPFDPLYALRCFGGREMAAIAGAVIGARLSSTPVILDGFVATAAASALHQCHPGSLDHCLIGHLSQEVGHRRLLDKIEKDPVLQMDMRLGEGSGAALAAALVKSAVYCHNGMATFGQAGVSEKNVC